MEINYTMIGADGLQYGPINLEQLKSWVAEGRVTGDTKISRSDTNSWLPAANYTELGLVQAVATPAPPTPQAANVKPVNAGYDPILVRRFRLGALWFYWVAGFSVVNMVILASGAGFYFPFGRLVIVEIINNPIASILIPAVFAMFGFFATKGQSWAFIVGMILYTVDALIFLKYSLWIELAFHAYVLFRLFQGVKSLIQLKSSAR